jgi:GntR family transcriptional repressor for pyruvate dehydrogenase complex
MFTPVKNSKVYDQVVEQIKKMIIEGTLKKGDKLPTERDLSEKLNVSRASVREAIRALEVIGILESRQGAGNYIRENFENSLFEPLSMMFILQESSPHEILEIRKVLELETAALASKKINEEELQFLSSIVDEMRNCIDENKNLSLDKSFHYTIAKASRNLLIINFLEVTSQLMDNFIKDSRLNILSKESNRAKLMKQHQYVYDALKERNELKAYEAMKEHFRLIEENYNF